jgi:hypothetical protein
MATARTASKPAVKPASRSRAQAVDAITLLRGDHKLVSALFEQYGKARSDSKKQALVTQICDELSVHATVEEEIFYPAVKAALKDRELVPEAVVEHATIKEFIAKLRGKPSDGEMFDAQVQVMGEYVKHHVKEEQTEMFPKARRTKLDMFVLGAQMMARKDELKTAPSALPREPTAVADLPAETPA